MKKQFHNCLFLKLQYFFRVPAVLDYEFLRTRILYFYQVVLCISGCLINWSYYRSGCWIRNLSCVYCIC